METITQELTTKTGTVYVHKKRTYEKAETIKLGEEDETWTRFIGSKSVKLEQAAYISKDNLNELYKKCREYFEKGEENADKLVDIIEEAKKGDYKEKGGIVIYLAIEKEKPVIKRSSEVIKIE